MNSIIIQKAREYALSEMDKYGLPSAINFALSEKKAIELALKCDADLDIVKLGSYLMDIKLGQAFSEGRLSDHVAMGIEAAKVFLQEYDLDQDVQYKIINCIAAHHKAVPFSCIESEVCANADCYRFVHPKGFFAYLNSLGRRNEDFDQCLTLVEQKMDEKRNILSLDICKQELLPCYHAFKRYIADARAL